MISCQIHQHVEINVVLKNENGLNIFYLSFMKKYLFHVIVNTIILLDI